jgi:hypothetical protein
MLLQSLLTLLLITNAAWAADPLSSWNDGQTKQSIGPLEKGLDEAKARG